MADALYELAEFTMHGDALQKGLTYQKVRPTQPSAWLSESHAGY